ncbi:hypothetical protein B4U80_11494 [Leptotrombidium deliense]|uniref:Poly [ADP-ribose] polymerase n=1 Tax=Leptotrombidium deliense TaxID=299467 RepID=A0A443SMI7_9ACAR|nr:hypothetical protein B4U80_11494 [Leptotrombidium deliense]
MSEVVDEELNFYRSRVLEILAGKTVEQLMPYDLKVTLFGAGLMTYRRESALRPFPSFLVKEEEKQFELTYEAFDAIPPINDINESTNLSLNTWRLLHWIISQDSVKLELIKCEETPNLFNKYQPNFLFKVITREKERFGEDKRKYGSFVGFHGSQVENFHSILYNGLLNCLNKRDLYGSGTYLSTRIEVAVEFSPFSGGFKNSLLGRRISCIAMCEVVKSPQIEEC